MLSIYEYAFKNLTNNFIWFILFIGGKGTEAVMYIIYFTALFSSLGGNIIKLFKFDYL